MTTPAKAIQNEIDKSEANFERWFSRAKRAIRAMEKARQQRLRLQKKMQALAIQGLEGRK